MTAMAKEFKVDGLVIHSARSCKPYSVGQYDIKRLMMDRLGLPSVVIEADITDYRNYSEETGQNQAGGLFRKPGGSETGTGLGRRRVLAVRPTAETGGLI